MAELAHVLSAVDEPVRRFFAHALTDPARNGEGARLAMRGHIKAGAWLPFTASEEVDARSFSWTARVGVGRLTVLRVIDRFAHGDGSTDGRLLGRFNVLHAAGPDTSRSAAGRVALEAVAFAPQCVLPGDGVVWNAIADDHIAVTLDVPPERTDVHVRIDDRGAVRSVNALRWGSPEGGAFDYVPCGCEVHEEARFGGVVIPARFSVGWWFGTPHYSPFFRVEITAYRPRRLPLTPAR